MENRFNRIFELQPNLLVKAAPIIINAGELLYDNNSKKHIIQLKLQSVIEKQIEAVEIYIDVFNVKNEHIETCKYQYLDIQADYGTVFGTGKAILVSAENPRSFSINSLSVVYKDNNIETYEFLEPISIVPQSLIGYFNDNELVEQYKVETTIKSKVLPQNIEDVWVCSCGWINKNEQCYCCKLDKTTAFKSLNTELLKNNLALRKEAEYQEEQRKAEQKQLELKNQQIKEAKEAELKEQQAKKIRKIIISIVCAIIVAVLLFGVKSIVNKYYVVPNGIYKEAMELKNSETYPEAIDKFGQIKSFKDAETQIEECNSLLTKQREALVEKYSYLNGKWISNYECDGVIRSVKYQCREANVSVEMLDNNATLTIELTTIHKSVKNEEDVRIGLDDEDTYKEMKFSFNLEDFSFISNYGTYSEDKGATFTIIDDNKIHIDIEGSVYEGGITFINDDKATASMTIETQYNDAIEYAENFEIEKAYNMLLKTDDSYKNVKALKKRMKEYINSGYMGCWTIKTYSYDNGTSGKYDKPDSYIYLCPRYMNGNIYFQLTSFFVSSDNPKPTVKECIDHLYNNGLLKDVYFELQNDGTLKEHSDNAEQSIYSIKDGILIETAKATQYTDGFKKTYARVNIE